MNQNFNHITSHDTMQTSAGSIGLRAAFAWMMLCLPLIKFRINSTKKHIFSPQPRRRTVLMALLFGVLVLTFAGPAYGAIAKVKDIDITSDITTGTTIQATVPAGGVAAGNTVIVAFVMDDADGTVSCADDSLNAYGTADIDQNNVNQVRTVIFSAYITTALSSGDKITVTHPSIGDRVIHAIEFSGLANSTVDQTGSSSGNATTLTSGNTTSTTADPNELLIGAIGVAGPSTDTFTPTTETPVWNKTEVTTSNDNIRLNSLYRIVTSTGQYAASGTNPRRKFAAGIATYKATAASLDQAHYRWRENDDTESAAAWQEDEDTKAALGRGYANRIRFLVENEGGQTSGAMTYQLEVAETATCSSGSYSAVPTDTSGDWQMVASQLVEGAATTNIVGSFTKPGGYTWVDGEQRETSNITGSITLAAQEFTEIEFSIKNTANVTYGGDYCFRLTDGGTPLDQYTAYAEAEVRCNFEYRRLLTVDKDQVGLDNNPGTLTDFPVLVHLTGNWLKTTTADPVNGRIEDTNGYDILFRYDGGSCTSGNPCDALDFEIEKYDGTNGELIAWVRIPSLSKSADTDFYIYYGNVCVTDDSQNATGVWDANYKGVWHLKEDPEAAAPQFLDSTTNPNDGTANTLAAANQVAGQIDGSLEFDDTNERHVSVSDHSSLQLSTNIAISAWVNTSDAETDTGVIVNKWSSGTSARNYWLGKLDDNVLAFFVDDTQSVTAGLSLINDGAWHHVTGVADVANSLLRIYVDGLEKNTTTYSGTSRTGTNALHIGHGSGENSQEFEGIIDEVRVSSTVRTADWIQTDYSNQYDATKDAGCTDNGFICMGSEESNPGTAVSLISFTAQGQGNAMVIEWETAREFDNIGFHLYRATSPGGPYNRLTDKLISATVTQGKGGSYSYLDTDVAVGSLYYYKLEDIDVYGKHTMHGPICVDWDADSLPDDWEITHGLSPWVNDANLDYDGDGLTNFEEYERELDPFNPDTDGDGILDGAEDGRLPVQPDNGSHSISRGIEVLAADASGMTIALNTSGFEAEVVPVGGEEFERLHVADYVHGYTGRVGAPQLPLKGMLIDVPAGKAAQLSVLNSSAEPFSGYHIYPVPEAVLDAQDGMAAVGTAFVQDELAYSTDGYYPQDVAQLGQGYLFRDQVKQQVVFYPMRFNPVSGQLFLYRRIELRIDFVDAPYAKVSAPVPMPWLPPHTTSGVLSSVAVGFAAAPMLASPISPILSSLGAAVTAFWSPPAEAEDGVYKILTDSEGIYRISKDYLDTNGVDTAAIDLSRLRIYYLGEEIAIEVFDQNSDDHFDDADYIRFYAVPVDSQYAKYSDQNVYWMTLAGGSFVPMRMASIEAAPAGGLLAADFTDIARHEQDIVYWLKAPGADGIERWFFNTYVQGTEHGGGGQPVPFTITVPEPVSSGTLTILMAGQTDTQHEVYVVVNGVEQSFSFNGIGYFQASLDDVPLFEGDNIVTLQCLSADGNDSIIVDWFEVVYQRDYVAGADNILKFAPDSGARYLIDGFSSNTLLAYDISDPVDVAIIENPLISGNNPYSFEFEPTAYGDTYLVLASEAGKVPVGLVEDTAADLAHNASGADYILITHRDLGWAQNGEPNRWLTDLVTHRLDQGLRVAVVDIEDIYDEFSFGIKSPQALKNFLAYAYSNWPQPAPQYVLLAGDSTYDPKDHWGEADDTAYLPTYLMFTDFKGETVTDQWFVTFSGNDALADMHIGRLPAADTAQVAVMVNKILTYETTLNSKFSDPNAWEKNILLVADDQRPGADYLYEADFATMNEDAAALLPAVMNPYPGYLGIHYASAAYLNDFITTTLNNEGALMVNYAGHGATQVWANEHILDTGDLAGLTNTAQLPFFVSMSCETGFFAYPEVWFYPSLAEALLRSDAGAVAAFMPSGMTTTEGQRILNSALFEHIFSEDIRTLGPAIASAKQTLLANGAEYEQISQTFLLFGDPATELKVPLPQIPKGVTVERQDGRVHIRWQAALDCNKSPVAGYNVYRSRSAGGVYSKINSALITEPQYLDTDPAGVSTQSSAGSAAASYYYGVTSVDSSGDESVQTLAISPPSPATNSGAGDGGAAGCFIATTTSPATFNLKFNALVIIVSIMLGFWLLQSIYNPTNKKNTAKKKLDPFNELKNVKTLLVDDDEFIRNSLELAFKTKGCCLQVAETAEQGLQAIKDEQFDIIISDLRLPGINGLDFLKLTAVTQPQAVKFLITAYRDDHIFSEAVRLGIDEFIEKPFAVKVLINLLALALKRQEKRQAVVAK